MIFILWKTARKNIIQFFLVLFKNEKIEIMLKLVILKLAASWKKSKKYTATERRSTKRFCNFERWILILAGSTDKKKISASKYRKIV